MNFLHTDLWGGADNLVLVTLNGQANVMLLDDNNFNGYRNGRSFHYFGGWATQSPVRLSPSHHGHWHVVVDLGGRAGSIRAGIRIIEGAHAAHC